MRYYGGKCRSGKEIAQRIVDEVESDKGEAFEHYVAPFSGMLGVEKHLNQYLKDNHITTHASDGCEDLILLLQEVHAGTFKDPGPITKDRWYELKYAPYHSSLRAYVGFGFSFSGIFFGAYTDSYQGTRLFDSLYQEAEMTEGFSFRHCDYRRALDGLEGRCIIYVDPPYIESACHFGSWYWFRFEEFVATVQLWKSQGHLVFVSEQKNFPVGRVVMSKKLHSVTKKDKNFDCILYVLDDKKESETKDKKMRIG
jgi:hypothetical protein